MFISERDKLLAKKKAKRQWIRTEWKSVEEIAKENNLCYSTWYDRVKAGKLPAEAASYPPCPIKGRKMKKEDYHG